MKEEHFRKEDENMEHSQLYHKRMWLEKLKKDLSDLESLGMKKTLKPIKRLNGRLTKHVKNE